MKRQIFALTKGGKKLAEKLSQALADAHYQESNEKIAKQLASAWPKREALICIMASGIVVRSIAPLLKAKEVDPAVIVVDEKGKYAISLLSGHLGGANQLAHDVAAICQGEAIITTASDTLGHTALDLWAKENGLFITDKKTLTEKAAKLVNQGFLSIYSDLVLIDLPHDLQPTTVKEQADIILSHQKGMPQTALQVVPKILSLGSGCNRGTPRIEFEQALKELCDELAIFPQAIAKLCSIDKKNDEQGLLQLAKQHGWQTLFYGKDELNRYQYLQHSAAALKAVGAIGVAEPAALLGAKQTRLYCGKRKWKNITMALAQEHSTLSVPAPAAANI